MWRAVSLLVVFASASTPARAQGTPVGSELQINTTTAGFQGLPAVAAGTGRFVVVWHDGSGLGGDPSAVFGQLLDSQAAPIGAELQVNTYTSGVQTLPSVTVDSAGGFVVVWSDEGRDGDDLGIFGQRLEAAGGPLGGDFQAHTVTAASQHLSSVAVQPDGAFVVVWEDASSQDGSPFSIFGRRFDSGGTAAGDELQINTFTGGIQTSPVAAVEAGGDFVVTWTDLSGLDGDSAGVRAQRFDSLGLTIGGEFQVNSHTTGFQGYPSIAAHPVGGFVVAWTDGSGQDGDAAGIRAQRFDGGGAAIGGELQVNSYTSGNQNFPAVASGPDGFVVVWTEYSGQDGDYSGIFSQQFRTNGSRAGGELQVNTDATARQRHPAVAVAPNGDFLVVWENDGGSGGGDVCGRIFAAAVPIFADGFESGDTGVWSSTSPWVR